VDSIRRDAKGISIKPTGQEAERFDAVVLACHSDQALALLADPTQAEQDILGAIRYQANEAVLHTDVSLLPKKRLAWAAWNYHIPLQNNELVALTYDMNILQALDAPETFCVTLNYAEAIDPARIIKRLVYHHPVYSRESIAAQKRHPDISGMNRTYYCGAYWGFGFHEDGVNSALRVVEQITNQENHG
jgi:predicted NAD/FAD-binding protein